MPSIRSHNASLRPARAESSPDRNAESTTLAFPGCPRRHRWGSQASSPDVQAHPIVMSGKRRFNTCSHARSHGLSRCSSKRGGAHHPSQTEHMLIISPRRISPSSAIPHDMVMSVVTQVTGAPTRGRLGKPQPIICTLTMLICGLTNRSRQASQLRKEA